MEIALTHFELLSAVNAPLTKRNFSDFPMHKKREASFSIK